MKEPRPLLRLMPRSRPALILTLSTALVSPASVWQQSVGTVAASDTALLSAVVRAARVDAGKLPVKADPRPLPVTSDAYVATIDNATFIGETSSMLAIPDSVLAMRTVAIRRLGVEPIDASVLAQSEACPGGES